MKERIIEIIKSYQKKVAMSMGDEEIVLSEENFSDLTDDIVGEILNTKDFKQASLPLISYLAKNCHPHHTVIVTSTGAELLESKKTTGEVKDFIVD